MNELDLENLLPGFKSRPLSQRVETVCKALLGSPYAPHPYGEGDMGKFDRRSVVRYDAFNCISFTETALCLAIGGDRTQVEFLLPQLRYVGGLIAFENRCHFIAGQWTTNNLANKLLNDTLNDSPELSGSFVREIDWSSWYRELPDYLVHRPDLSPMQRNCVIEELREAGQGLGCQVIEERYIPFERLFCPTSEAAGGSTRAYGSEYLNERLLNQLPKLAVVVFYGTNNEHVGIASLNNESGIFYHTDFARPSRALCQDFLEILSFRHRFTNQVGFRVFGINADWPGL